MSNKGRTPDGQELSLWQAVIKTVKPIAGKGSIPQRSKANPSAEAASEKKTSSTVKKNTAPDNKIPPRMAVKSPKGKELDRRTYDRLHKGKIPIEGILDLHGMTQEQAHTRLNAFVTNAFQQQKRCVLVITGKGKRSEGDGVLKSRLPDWVMTDPLNDIVLQCVAAHHKHGGGGAFYLYLRRNRTPSP